MNRSIFREYDIRGIVGTDLLLQQARMLGSAIGMYLRHEMGDTPCILLGRDGRIHSPALAHELTQGLCDVGINVIDVGICPSPGLYFATYHHNISHGLMVTASHNPAAYNGIKIWKVSGTRLQELADLFYQLMANNTLLPNVARGSITHDPIVPAYTAHLVALFPELVGSTMPFVIDCANGSACSVLPLLTKQMRWPNATLLFDKMDGNFPNHDPDPTEEHNVGALRTQVLGNACSLGIGLDGDCDRMTPISATGTLVGGDKLLAIFGQDVLANNPEACIVLDIKGSSSVVSFLKQRGARVQVSPSGHTLIKSMMAQHNAMLGGELSCHFFFKDRYFGYDDGIYAMLRLLQLLQRQRTTLDMLLAQLPTTFSSPEIRITCTQATQAVQAVKKWLEPISDAHLITIDGVKAEFTHGWGLVRASNTQPVLCLRFEADSPEYLVDLQERFAQVLEIWVDSAKLYQQLGIIKRVTQNMPAQHRLQN